MIAYAIIFVVMILVFVKIEFWMYRRVVDAAIARGHNVTLGNFGGAHLGDYKDLIDYAARHPGRVSISVKSHHMTVDCIVRMSRSPGVKIVWIAAKWPDDRWHELEKATEAHMKGGNVGFTVAAYNSDSLELAKEALSSGIPIRLVKGYYRSDLRTSDDIRNRYRDIMQLLAASPSRREHLLATHDPKILSQIPSDMKIAQYLTHGGKDPSIDLFIAKGRPLLTLLQEGYWIGRPMHLKLA